MKKSDLIFAAMPDSRCTTVNTTSLILAACAFLGFSLFQHRVIVAECGDYVTIGNKEKLAELKAAGYKVGPEMDSHETSLTGTSLNEGQPVGIPMPCSSPQCKSNNIPTPVPTGIAVSISVFKSGINGNAKQPFERDSQFSGYQNHNEQPTEYPLSLDRPPE